MSEPRPRLAEFRALFADADSVPVFVERAFAGLTPVSAMMSLGAGAGCFLLESVEGPERVARWSLLGANPRSTISSSESGDPLDLLGTRIASLKAARVAGLDAPFSGGAVGFLAYEAAQRYERLPRAANDPLGIPDAWFGIYDTVIVFDHAQHRVILVTNVFRGDAPAHAVDDAYAAAVARLRNMETWPSKRARTMGSRT